MMPAGRMLVGMGLVVLTGGLARSQDPAKAFPENYRVVLDNATVRVFRVHYGPHERVGVHDHSSYPTVYVYLNDAGPVRFAHAEDAPFVLVRPPTHTGAFRVSPGRVERHSVENLSATPSDYLRVELKGIPLGTGLTDVRGAAPGALTGDERTVVYRSRRMVMERLVCGPERSCAEPAAEGASLLLAVNAARVTGRGEMGGGEMGAGEVRWEAKPLAIGVSGVGGRGTDLLRIDFPVGATTP